MVQLPLPLSAYNWDINLWVFHAVKSIASTPLNGIMYILSFSYLAVVPLLLIFMYLKRDRGLYAVIAAVIASFVVSEIIKFLVLEPIPCSVPQLSWINVVSSCVAGSTFPSTHAAALAGVSMFLGRYRRLQALYVVWAILILFSMIYLGVHYFTDVIAGAGLSILLFYPAYRYRKRFEPGR